MYDIGTGCWNFVREEGSARAACRCRPGRTEVSFLDDTATGRPAKRWPDEPMPACPDGHIAFDGYPALDEVREWLPEYGPLWDAVQVQSDMLLSPNRPRHGVPGEAAWQHGRFFDEPFTV